MGECANFHAKITIWIDSLKSWIDSDSEIQDRGTKKIDAIQTHIDSNFSMMKIDTIQI